MHLTVMIVTLLKLQFCKIIQELRFWYNCNDIVIHIKYIVWPIGIPIEKEKAGLM